MFILFVLNVCIMLVIGKVHPAEKAWVPTDSHAVDMTPWPMAKPLGALIVLIVISTYFFFT
ncbi:MAG: hypothetical protein KDJ81_16380, partial [Rhodobacteraceae bacterium]|nr:hypothetical protein [Paracoccaceae bacterium]